MLQDADHPEALPDHRCEPDLSRQVTCSWLMPVTPPSHLLYMSQMVQTFRLPAKCSASQHRRLTVIFGMCSEFYNAALESWKGTYAWWKEHHNPEREKFPKGLSQSHYDRLKMFTGVRSDLPEWERLSVKVGRGVLCRFDRTIRAFTRDVRREKNLGIPGSSHALGGAPSRYPTRRPR